MEKILTNKEDKNNKPKPDDEKKHELETQPEAKTGTDLMVYDFGEDAGAGQDNVSADERRIPFLTILDPKSPQCKPVSAGGIAGAKGGSFFNTSSGEVFDGEKGLDAIFVDRTENYVEWYPKEEDGSGGGFVGIRAPDDELVLKLKATQGKFGKLKTDFNPPTELIQTFYLYGFIFRPDDATHQEPIPVIFGFKSTQIKKYQGFIDRTKSIRYQGPKGLVEPPIWAHMWHVSTKYEEKNSFSWYGWVINSWKATTKESFIKMSDPLYQLAKEFYTSIRSGRKAADFASQAKTDTVEEEIPM